MEAGDGGGGRRVAVGGGGGGGGGDTIREGQTVVREGSGG